MFYSVCTACAVPSVAELVRIDDDYAHFRCLSGHEGFQSLTEFPDYAIEMGREWLYIQEKYPQGSEVRIRQGKGPYRKVEVVGHKAQSIRTGRPAVRVYIPGYGSVLFGRDLMDRWNIKK